MFVQRFGTWHKSARYILAAAGAAAEKPGEGAAQAKIPFFRQGIQGLPAKEKAQAKTAEICPKGVDKGRKVSIINTRGRQNGSGAPPEGGRLEKIIQKST